MAGERVGNFLDDMEPAAVAAPLPIKVLLSDQDDAELLILDDGQGPDCLLYTSLELSQVSKVVSVTLIRHMHARVPVQPF